MSAHHVVAIDGPAASGKSSVARALAKRLRYCYVNSGAMYRAVTWRGLDCGVAVEDYPALVAFAEKTVLVCKVINDEAHISIDTIDPSAHLYGDDVNSAVSFVSRIPLVREIVNAQLRHCAADRDVVIEGRDIGSVVFPETPFKFFLDATPEVRVNRRRAQGQRDEIALRDRADSSRRTAPLIVASDAEVIDTSDLAIGEVVEEILRKLTERGLQTESAASRR
ncbi:MAG TPA: (d)CMP kinase [Chthoniobacterales bacterium]|jgi:cytidylate kinase